MIHGYGLKINGTCYNGARRFTPMRECTAYITFDNDELNLTSTDFTQAANLARTRRSQFDNTVRGQPYNCTPQQSPTSFPNYYFDKTEVASWGFRGVDCSPDFSSCALRFRGPKFRNNLAVIPLKKHSANPLKQGRLTYDFLNSRPSDTHSALENMLAFTGELDPLEFAGFYPYAPGDPLTIQKPAGWMYSNTNVPEPYFTQNNYEAGGGSIDRTTANNKQLNFMPFLDPLHVYNLNEVQIGQFDGLAFVLFFGEMAFKYPVLGLPEYDGLLKDFMEAENNFAPPYMNPTWQYFGLELNIFLAGDGVPSPRIGRQRFMMPNRDGLFSRQNNPAANYFSLHFKPFQYDSIDMPMNFSVKPSQVLEGDPILPIKLPFSNLTVMVGA